MSLPPVPSPGITGYYPDFFFPKLAKEPPRRAPSPRALCRPLTARRAAQARDVMMPKVVTGFYFRVFRGPPVGALYKMHPGPWQARPNPGPITATDNMLLNGRGVSD